MVETVENKICKICGGKCCQYPMTKIFLYKDEDKLFEGTGLEVHDTGSRMYVDLQEAPDRRCPHLKDGRCVIYKKRPYNCQYWPFVETSVTGCMLIAYRRGFGNVISFSTSKEA